VDQSLVMTLHDVHRSMRLCSTEDVMTKVIIMCGSCKFQGTEILYRAGSAVPEVVCSSPMRVIIVPHSSARQCPVNRKPTAESMMLKELSLCLSVKVYKCVVLH